MAIALGFVLLTNAHRALQDTIVMDWVFLSREVNVILDITVLMDRTRLHL
jgi:hypothetical protein